MSEDRLTDKTGGSEAPPPIANSGNLPDSKNPGNTAVKGRLLDSENPGNTAVKGRLLDSENPGNTEVKGRLLDSKTPVDLKIPADAKNDESQIPRHQRESAPALPAREPLKMNKHFKNDLAPTLPEREAPSAAGTLDLKTVSENRGAPAPENSPEFLKEKGNDYFYNQGIQRLKKGKEQAALPFLQKSFYRYLFFPAYQALSRLQHPPRLWPVLWHITAGLYGLFTIFWLGFLLKKSAVSSASFLLKGVMGWFLGMAILALSAFFSLQKRAGALTELEGHSAPFAESAVLWTLPEGADVRVLKTDKQWVQIKTAEGQKGWVKLKNLLFTLE